MNFYENSKCLSKFLMKTLQNSGFDKLIYYKNRDENNNALPSPFLPQVDISVIIISPNKCIKAAANILYDRDNPNGFSVCLSREKLTANNNVKFFVWREDRWLNSEIWNSPIPKKDVLTNPLNPKLQFMLPYPGSCLKTLIAFYFMKLIEQNKIKLSDIITYDTNDCPSPPIPSETPLSASLNEWLTQMITVSYNFAAIVLLQYLFKFDYLEKANNYFKSIGLDTLYLEPSLPNCGRFWYDGKMGLGSLDICKLLMIVFGVKGALWKVNSKFIYSKKELSVISQEYLQNLLANDAFAECLNPVAVCGSKYHQQGLPTTVPKQFIDKKTGSLSVPILDEGYTLNYDYDMYPCLQNASLKFYHKIGLTDYTASDHGYIKKIDSNGNHIIIALNTSAGILFQDYELRDQYPNACENLNLCFSNAFSKIAQSIIQFLEM